MFYTQVLLCLLFPALLRCEHHEPAIIAVSYSCCPGFFAVMDCILSNLESSKPSLLQIAFCQIVSHSGEKVSIQTVITLMKALRKVPGNIVFLDED